MEEHPPVIHRSLRLDAVRGVAVVGMIAAHAIYFFHNNTNPFLVSLEGWLNATVFTLFVFVSGFAISRFLDTHAHVGVRKRAILILKRTGLFYIAYVVTAIAATLTAKPIGNLSGALTMLAPPNFTEYLPLFILLSLFIFPLWRVFHVTRRSIVMTIITGGFAYAIGVLLFPLNFGPVLEPVKELFAGGGTALRFPFLFYIPVFLWGLWWDKKESYQRGRVAVAAGIISLAGIIAAVWYYIPVFDPGTRWPPSIPYLTTGIAVAAILMSIVPPVRVLVYAGKHSLWLWVGHLFVLFLYRRFIDLQFGLVAVPILTGSAYGNFMPLSPLAIEERAEVRVHMSADRTWYVRHIRPSDVVDIAVETDPVHASAIAFTIGTTVKKLSANYVKDGILHYEIPVSDFIPGEYPITATVDNVQSNTVTIFVSEPFLVAWTFDWEGWNASDWALRRLEEYRIYDGIRFTHFVNPRMFLPGVLTPARRAILTEYLQKRQMQGDEIALHTHMQFDLVKAAGVTPRTTHPWGLRTAEGYDVPMTQYSPEEFRTILTFARKLLMESGMPLPRGFRAGGWFLNEEFLKILAQEKFAYDSSGRDSPATGPFSTVSWSLPVGAQPYIPQDATILEIPDNGVSTSESTAQELLDRVNKLYPGGILNTPKTFIVASHPQFAENEFPEIPGVLSALAGQSVSNDAGPLLFVTMWDIYKLWTTSFLQ